MKKLPLIFSSLQCLSLALLFLPGRTDAASNAMVSWNNLGMHCMDSDYSVFSILPPYNTIQAQIIYQGKLVTNSSGFTVTYQAVADSDGSFNATSLGKGNFYTYAQVLYGTALSVDAGLAGFSMPGATNVPQAMAFDSPWSWFIAEGIPITPYDDAFRKNPYPMMRLIARDAGQNPVATNDIVLPVSDEMDCRACHASGSKPDAAPVKGWIWASDPERDYRLNILRLHDEHRFAVMPETYPGILSSNGFNVQGLYRTVVADGRPILCAKCHKSNALPGTGFGDISPLTQAVHGLHAHVMDPELQLNLEDANNRAACYRCHPGSTTRCLRGTMGNAIATDGSRAMQCQSCHGSMSQVGAANREGWLDEPNCQSCHTGTATSNNGQIRYVSSFEPSGNPRVAVNQTFATNPNIPATGLSLYRFSRGHGGLQCAGCHNSTHAEYPSSHANDNVHARSMQGHTGVISECTACHLTMPGTSNGGPHGLHPVGQGWVSQHRSAARNLGRAWCAGCHGADFKGTVLSRAFTSRSLSVEDLGTITFWRGFQIGCYDCHQGPDEDEMNPNSPPVVTAATANTTSGQPVTMNLSATDVNGDPLTLRIVTQPVHGAVALSNRVATYVSEAGFVGTDTFTFAANDGSTESNLGTGTVTVSQGAFGISVLAHVPENYPALWSVPFGTIATSSNINGTVSYAWDFNDGSSPDTNQHTTHTYLAPGTYPWKVIATVQGPTSSVSATNSGVISITAPVSLKAAPANPVQLSWTLPTGDALLEWTAALGTVANWEVDTNVVTINGDQRSVNIDNPETGRFYRLKKL